MHEKGGRHAKGNQVGQRIELAAKGTFDPHHARDAAVEEIEDAGQQNESERDLDGFSSKKEFDALNIEVASLEKRNNDLEEEALHMMTQVEERMAKVPEFEQAIAKAKADYAKAEEEHQTQLPAWQARLKEAKKVVAEKTSMIPEDWKKAFTRLETNEGADALASLNGRSCSACYTDVTAQQLAMITCGRVEACKNCGKLLYILG